jgi:hypothetical protein
MKILSWLGLTGFVLLLAPASRADDRATCLEAASKGQRLRANHQLVDAREQFRICAAARCPAVVRSDCTRWVDAVEGALPTVVVTAKTATGTDVVAARVSLDGRPFADQLDGRAVPVDPGAHTFHLETPDGVALDQVFVVREGEQNQSVTLVLPGRAAPSPAPGPVPATTAPAEPASESTASASTPWPAVGWVLGGAGVVGLGVGVAFGVAAMGDKNDAQCNAAGQCLAGPLADARHAAVGADVAFVAGGVLLAGGVALLLIGPRASAGHEDHKTAHVRLVPGVGALRVDGSW